MSFVGVCEVCHVHVVTDAVNPKHQPVFPVTGWEAPREGGGTNHLLERKRVPGRVRHRGCLPSAVQAGAQESLL